LEVQRRGWGGEGEFGEEDDGQRLRAGDDEHVGEIVGEDARERGVEGGGEGGGAEAGAQVRVVAGLDGEDGAGGCDQGRVVGEGSGAADVGADADAVVCSAMVTMRFGEREWLRICLRGDHVGEGDKGPWVGVREFVGARRHRRDSVAGEHLGERIDVNLFLLFVGTLSVTTERPVASGSRTSAMTQTFSLKPGGKPWAMYWASVKFLQPPLYRLSSRCSRNKAS